MPVVLYLHGNSSSRIEGLKVLPELLKRNINLFVVDFAGCGLSEGEYISLGWHEKNDVITIIDFIERLPRVGKIGIWGRSMGAATTLMFNKIDSRASAACYDSSFSEFTKLAKELCKKHVKIPGVIISVVMSLVRNSIIERNYLDIYKLNPIESASCIKCPGFFIHAKNDELIPIDHSIDIYSNYQGKKTMNVCDGSHNTVRQKQLQEKVADFFKRYLHNNDNDSNIRGKTSSKNLPGINKIYNKDNKQKSKNKSLSSKDLNLGLSKLSF